MAALPVAVPAQRRIGSSHTALFYVGGTLMIDMGTITSAIGGVRAAIDLAKVAMESRDASKIAEARSTMLDRLLDVQDACMRLQEANAMLLQDKHTLAQQVRDLENQLLTATQQADQRAAYEEFEPYPGTTVLRKKGSQGTTDPGQYVCPSCMDNRKLKSHLQFNGRRASIATCHECGKSYRFADTPSASLAKTAGGPQGWMV